MTKLARLLSYALLVIGLSTTAFASSEYVDSALAAIQSANGQAKLDLVKGRYKAVSGSSYMIFEIPSDMGSRLRFKYEFRALVSGSWDFDKSIFVELYVNGKCVRLEVKKLAYEDGGFLAGNSDQTIVPDGSCRESEPLSRMDDFLRLTPDPGEFFKGAAFVSISSIKRCVNSTCTQLANGLPIRRATFYGSSKDGKPLPGLAATLEEGSRIILPRNGFLVLAANSGAAFHELQYDLEAKSGRALLKKFEVNLSEGLISGGDTVFHVAPDSHLTAEQVAFEKDDVAVKIIRGSLEGKLGEGTSVLISSSAGRTSTLNITYAKASLLGMAFEGSASGATLSFARGILSTKLESGEIWFTDRNSIRLGYTNIDLVLGCPADTPIEDCRPLVWGPTKVSVYGTINSFSSALTGGQFNISNVGLVRLASGQIAADNLTIDTTDPVSPVTGRINKFEVALEGQDLAIDDSTTARLARAEVKGYDLIYKTGQSLPIGMVTVIGSASSIEGGKVGKIKFEAEAKLELKISRRDADEPEIIDGNVSGTAKVSMSEGNYVRVEVDVSRLRYHGGHGDAVLRLAATEGSYTYHTPSAYEEKEELGFEAHINLYSIKLVASLVNPVVIGPTNVKASHASWSIDPVLAIPFKLQIPIAQQELIYAPIESPVGGTLCAPKVILLGQRQEITGKIDVFAASTGGKLKVYDGALSPGVVAQADDRGCSKVGALVCFLVGSAFGGPIGGAALGCLCYGKIEEGEAELGAKIRDGSIKKIADSKFEFGF